jgi:hypothetical protein
MFEIKIVWKSKQSKNYIWKIVIDDFSEEFEIYTTFCDLHEYKSQWLEWLDRIVNQGKNATVLLTSNVRWRVINKKWDNAYVTEQLFIEDIIWEELDFTNPYKYLKDRELDNWMSNDEIEQFQNDWIIFEIQPKKYSE